MLITILIASSLLNQRLTLAAESAPIPASWKQAAVAADHPLASEAGVEMLRQGGNVVDAAVAVGFALSVLRPGSSGMGGGGFMVIWDAKNQRAIALDYRERAPLAATRNMYAQGGSEASQRGALAVAVPGHVRGLCHALKKYGTLPLSTVLQPAIRLAKDGVTLDAHELAVRQSKVQSARKLSKEFSDLWKEYLSSGELSTTSDDETTRPWKSPQLPALELLASDGVDAFYQGPIAESIVRHIQSRGGILTLEDFRQMDVVERRPLSSDFDDMQIVAMPPPSSGGVAIIECLNILTWLEKNKLNGRLESLGHREARAKDQSERDATTQRLRPLLTRRRRRHVPLFDYRRRRKCRRLHGNYQHSLWQLGSGSEIRHRPEQRNGRLRRAARRAQRLRARPVRSQRRRPAPKATVEHVPDDSDSRWQSGLRCRGVRRAENYQLNVAGSAEHDPVQDVADRGTQQASHSPSVAARDAAA